MFRHNFFNYPWLLTKSLYFFSYFGMLYSTYYFHVLSVHSPVHPSRLSYYLSCLLFVLHFWITMFLWQIKGFAIHKHFQFWMTIFCVHLSDFSHLLWLLFGTFLLLLFELLYLIFIFQFSTLTFHSSNSYNINLLMNAVKV